MTGFAPLISTNAKKESKKKDKKKTDKRITVYAIVIATRNFVVLTRNFCNMYRSIK